MVTLSLTRLAAAVAGLALSLTAGAGVASADPDLGPIVNTTCSYPQVMAALNAQDPAAAGQINSSSMAQSSLQRFLAAPPSERLADGPADRELTKGSAVLWTDPTGRRHLQQLLSGLGARVA